MKERHITLIFNSIQGEIMEVPHLKKVKCDDITNLDDHLGIYKLQIYVQNLDDPTIVYTSPLS